MTFRFTILTFDIQNIFLKPLSHIGLQKLLIVNNIKRELVFGQLNSPHYQQFYFKFPANEKMWQKD